MGEKECKNVAQRERETERLSVYDCVCVCICICRFVIKRLKGCKRRKKTILRNYKTPQYPNFKSDNDNKQRLTNKTRKQKIQS